MQKRAEMVIQRLKKIRVTWLRWDHRPFGVYRRASQVSRFEWRWNFIRLFNNDRIHAFRSGFGVEQLRDNCMDTYWQSDGQLPHLVNIQFQRKTAVNQIYIYTDYKLDESYTPSRISIRSGTHFNDLQEMEIIDLCEPTGKYFVYWNHFFKFYYIAINASYIFVFLFQAGCKYRWKISVIGQYAHLWYK